MKYINIYFLEKKNIRNKMKFMSQIVWFKFDCSFFFLLFNFSSYSKDSSTGQSHIKGIKKKKNHFQTTKQMVFIGILEFVVSNLLEIYAFEFRQTNTYHSLFPNCVGIYRATTGHCMNQKKKKRKKRRKSFTSIRSIHQNISREMVV